MISVCASVFLDWILFGCFIECIRLMVACGRLVCQFPFKIVFSVDFRAHSGRWTRIERNHRMRNSAIIGRLRFVLFFIKHPWIISMIQHIFISIHPSIHSFIQSVCLLVGFFLLSKIHSAKVVFAARFVLSFHQFRCHLMRFHATNLF